MNEDVFPIQDGDFPAIALFVFRRVGAVSNRHMFSPETWGPASCFDGGFHPKMCLVATILPAKTEVFSPPKTSMLHIYVIA